MFVWRASYSQKIKFLKLYFSLIIATFVFIVFGSTLTSELFVVNAQQPEVKLLGFAWSSTIGWLEFGDWENSVKVSGNTLSGYAWSPNIGWVRFGGNLGNPPSGSSFATISGNQLNGWARACSVFISGCDGETKNVNGSELGGWDGWISLKGVNYGAVLSSGDENTETDWSAPNPNNSFSWGSTNVGWLSFAGVYRDDGEDGPAMSLSSICSPDRINISLNNLPEDSKTVEIYRDNITSPIHIETNHEESSFKHDDNDVSSGEHTYRVVITIGSQIIELNGEQNLDCAGDGALNDFSISKICSSEGSLLGVRIRIIRPIIDSDDSVSILRNDEQISVSLESPGAYGNYVDKGASEGATYTYKVIVNNDPLDPVDGLTIENIDCQPITTENMCVVSPQNPRVERDFKVEFNNISLNEEQKSSIITNLTSIANELGLSFTGSFSNNELNGKFEGTLSNPSEIISFDISSGNTCSFNLRRGLSIDEV